MSKTTQDSINEEFANAIRYLANDQNNSKGQMMTISLLIDYLTEKLQTAKTPEGLPLIDIELDKWPEWAQARTQAMRAEAEKMIEESQKAKAQEPEIINLNE